MRWLLSHRAGLPAVRELLPPEALYDWDAMCAALAAQEPWWEPGTAHGYHAVTFGWLVGEVVRRITGRSLGTYFRDEIARPLGLDLHIGLAEAEHRSRRRDERDPHRSDRRRRDRARAGDLLRSAEHGRAGVRQSALDGARPEQRRLAAAPRSPAPTGTARRATWRASTARWRAAARSTACSVLDAGEHRALRRRAVARARPACCRSTPASASASCCRRTGPTPASARARAPSAIPAPAARSASPIRTTAIGFGYVMNRMGPHILLDPRAIALIDAVYECVLAVTSIDPHCGGRNDRSLHLANPERLEGVHRARRAGAALHGAPDRAAEARAEAGLVREAQPERAHSDHRRPRQRRLRGVRVGRDPHLPGGEDRPPACRAT